MMLTQKIDLKLYNKQKNICHLLKYLFKSSVETTDQYQSCHKTFLKEELFFQEFHAGIYMYCDA